MEILFGFQQGYDTSGYAFIVRKGFIHFPSSIDRESYPVEKHAKVCEDDQQSETSYENLVFMGSNVISGSAEGIIVSVGNETLFGHVAETLSENQFNQALN